MRPGRTGLVLPAGTTLTESRAAGGVLVRSWVETASRSRELGLSAHGDVELAWVEAGRITYRIGSRTHAADAGAVLVVPEATEHATRIEPGTRAVSLHLGVELVAGVAGALGPAFRDARVRAGPAPAPERLVRLAGLLRDEASSADPGAALVTDALAEALAVHLLRASGEGPGRAGGQDTRIRRALDLVAGGSTEGLTVMDMARAAGMSRYHFSRRFREVVGSSPYRYILEVRLARAAELLRSGRLSVTEAALEAGFTDLGRFSVQFRRSFGCRPSDMAAARSARRTARIA